MYHDIIHLRQNGYTVTQKSPYHFQIIGRVTLNIWPTARKWMVQYDSGASYYQSADHLLNIVKDKIGKLGSRKMSFVDKLQRERELNRTDEEREAQLLWQKARYDLAISISTDSQNNPLSKAH